MQTDNDLYLPHDLVVENILTRLELVILIKCGCVCKLWYKSIHNDPHFLSSHIRRSRKNPMFIFYLWNKDKDDHYLCHFYDILEDTIDHRIVLERSSEWDMNVKEELVGHCDGLVCLSDDGYVEIINLVRCEVLYIFRPIFDGRIICYGFGFDSVTKEYKVVHIFRTFQDEFKILVFTLGTNSWRETTMPPPRPHQLLTPEPYSRSAIYCGGGLFWRTHENMLLSFDLHDETFQVIRLPAEIVSKTTTDQQQKLVHLLRYKGSLCVGRLEMIFVLGSDGNHQSTSRSYKVHLHILKDKVKKVWIKETFNLDSSLLNISFDDNIRMVNCFLYWLNGGNLELYNLRTKQFTVVSPARDDPVILGMKEPIGDNMDYQLISSIENIQSLKIFVPEGARKIEADALDDIMREGPRTPGGYFATMHDSNERYIFN